MTALIVKILRASRLALACGFLATAGAAHAQQTTRLATAPLGLVVYTSGEDALLVNSTLILGASDAILVDAQLTLANAHRLVAAILESGRRLTTIYITHAHPDHYLGLDVLRQAFPSARVTALPGVIEDMQQRGPRALTFWASRLGNNVSKALVVPEPLGDPRLMLDGETIEVIGPIQGDLPTSSMLWIPSIRAVIAGDLVFGAAHVWTASSTKEMRAAWLASLDRIENLRPALVVPGHLKPGTPLDASTVQHTRAWLTAFDAAVARAGRSGDVVNAMQQAFPEDGLALALEAGAKAAVPDPK